MLDGNSTLRAAGGDEVLLLRAKCAELELMLAQQNELVADLSQQNAEMSKLAHTRDSNGIVPTMASDGDVTLAQRDQNYQLRKDIVALTERNTTLERDLHRSTEAMHALQINLTREIQRAREEGERQSVFLRSQLVEAKEHAALLQEKVAGQLGATAEAFRRGDMHDPVTERILITSEAVLYRFKTENPTHVYRTRYDVAVEFDGRYMVLSGSRLNVQLLKADVMEKLTSFYASMSDPTKYVPAAKAREQAKVAESDHLRRTVGTHESTISSLHTALRLAQERTEGAAVEAETARSRLAVEMQKMNNERDRMTVEKSEHQRQKAALLAEIADLKHTLELSLRSLQSEAALGKELRAELDSIRGHLQDQRAQKELADRTSYVAKEQAKATESTFSNLMMRAQQAESEQRRAEVAEREVRALKEAAVTANREREQMVIAHSREKGKLEERINALIAEIGSQKARVDDSNTERDKVQTELQSANALIAELRERIGGVRSAGGAAVTIDDLTAKTRRVEAENTRLREELHRSFCDLKAMAQAMQETRAVREQALKDVERLEMERARTLDEKQRAEMDAVQAKMQFGAREAELSLLLETAREEAEHHRARAEMLHGEYQGRLRDLLEHVEGRSRATAAPADESSPSAAAVRNLLDAVDTVASPAHQESGLQLPSPVPMSRATKVLPTPQPSPTPGSLGAGKLSTSTTVPASAGDDSTTSRTGARLQAAPTSSTAAFRALAADHSSFGSADRLRSAALFNTPTPRR